VLRNREIAELLSVEAKDHTEQRRRTLQRAARAALWRWTEEAADLYAQGRSLTELSLVGPWLASIIGRWLEEPPPVAAPSTLREGFLTLADARETLASHPDWLRAYRGDLQMHTTWSDGAAYDEKARDLARRFRENYEKYDESGKAAGGPTV